MRWSAGTVSRSVSVTRFFKRPWLRRSVVVLSVAYPVALLITLVLFRFVGEGWWVTSVAMFLPRVAFGLPLLVLVPALLLLREYRLLASQVVALFLLVFPLMGFVLPGPSPAASNKGFRLLSFNVNSSATGRDAVFAEIALQNADIVLLQESTEWSELHELLKRRYPAVVVSTQFLVASRWPVLSTTDPPRLAYGPDQRSPRFLRHVIQTPLGNVTFYNVHPLSPRENFYALRGDRGFTRELRSGRLFAGAAAKTVEDNAALRALQIRAFAEMAVRDEGPVVIAGDINQPDPSPLVAEHLADFRDAFRTGGWGFGYTFPGAAFKGRRTPKRPWMRLDRIFMRGPITATRVTVACDGVSDHWCVVADLAKIP
jgi:endonuclease/exonuclease/phosphatase (EEP) superfamily protein YafD